MREVYFPPFFGPGCIPIPWWARWFLPLQCVHSGESCAGSGGGGGGGGGVSGAHVKTEGERVGKVARMIGELEEQSAWTHWTCAPRLSLSHALSLLSHPHTLTPPLSLPLSSSLFSISHFFPSPACLL